MAKTWQQCTKTCNCVDIVTVTPVTRSCQSVKALFRWLLNDAPSSPHLSGFRPDVPPRFFHQEALDYWFAAEIHQTTSRITIWKMKETNSTCRQIPKVKGRPWNRSSLSEKGHGGKLDLNVALRANLSDTQQARLVAFAFVRSLFTPSSFNYTSAQPSATCHQSQSIN